MLRRCKLRHLALGGLGTTQLTDEVLYALEPSVNSLEELRLSGAAAISHAGWSWLTAAMVSTCGTVPLIALDLSGGFVVSDEWLCGLRAPRLSSLRIDLGFATLPPLHDKMSRLGVGFWAVLALFRENAALLELTDTCGETRVAPRTITRCAIDRLSSEVGEDEVEEEAAEIGSLF